MLADFVIDNFYPECLNRPNKYEACFLQIVSNTAKMISKWMSVGFCHGVMNTDNMSILGLTIDYGPYGFLDEFNPKYICNHSDKEGRYSFDKQPQIALWNLNCLAYTWTKLASEESLKSSLESFQTLYLNFQKEIQMKKFGLMTEFPEDSALLNDFYKFLASEQADFTRSFRMLSSVEVNSQSQKMRDEFVDRQGFDKWVDIYQARLKRENSDTKKRISVMNLNNPKFILRNYIAQNVIEKAEHGDFSELKHVFKLLENPYSEQIENEDYSKIPPEWAKKIQVSCSS